MNIIIAMVELLSIEEDEFVPYMPDMPDMPEELLMPIVDDIVAELWSEGSSRAGVKACEDAQTSASEDGELRTSTSQGCRIRLRGSGSCEGEETRCRRFKIFYRFL